MEKEIFLYNCTSPGSANVNVEEKVKLNSDSSRVVTGVSKPSLLPFFPEKPDGTAILVIPGGSYNKIALDKEGIDIAAWLNTFGITAFVLKYRMPSDGHENAIDVPLQDAQRAMRLIRSSSEKFGIKPDKIGAIGFSAGGHLVSTLGTCFNMKIYEPLDKIDEESARPDFIAIAYPGISANGCKLIQPPKGPDFPELYEKYATDSLVTQETPQAFIVVANDDMTTPAEHSLCFYSALRKSKVPAELHIFRKGKHGFGIRNAKGPVAYWTTLFRNWLESVIQDN